MVAPGARGGLVVQTTPQERRQQYIAAMGAPLGKQFYRLTNECARLHLKWKDFVTLFGTSEQRIQLLNSAAPAFFVMVCDCLWEDILLHLSRLVDADKRTLSTRPLSRLVVPELRTKVEGLSDELFAKTAFARDWRHRHIAHLNRALALDEGAKPLAGASRIHVKEAIAALVNLLNAISVHYGHGLMAYEYASQLGDAGQLLHTIYAGVEANQQRMERLRAGTPAPGDFEIPTWLRSEDH
jgi:hypothetical protein